MRKPDCQPARLPRLLSSCCRHPPTARPAVMERPRKTLSISACATHDYDALILEPRNQSASRPAEHEREREQNAERCSPPPVRSRCGHSAGTHLSWPAPPPSAGVPANNEHTSRSRRSRSSARSAMVLSEANCFLWRGGGRHLSHQRKIIRLEHKKPTDWKG